jgi:hypothetical protein
VVSWCTILYLMLTVIPAVSADIGVVLYSPIDNYVFNDTRNVTFSCNATDDENVFNISLYTDIGGDFALNETEMVMELEEDSDTLLLCRFSNYTCEAGEAAEASGTGIVQSMFISGVMVNNSDTLRYPTSGNLNFTQGTLEFWIRLGVDPTTEFWLFSTGEQAVDEIHIYNDIGDLYFEYFDDSGFATAVVADISSWSPGGWHHVAGIWDIENGVGNGEVIDLFIDGSNSSTSIDSTDFGSLGTPGQYFYIGSLADGSEQADSVFDELRTSGVPRTESEINASYMKGAGNHSSENANWTITGIADGTYRWNCLAYDNRSHAAWGASDYAFHVDIATPPAVNSVSLSPSGDDDLDPGVTVNVTANITDPSNVSAAIFQYKLEVDWINVTMEDMGSDLWNASFATVSSDRVYYYRIWSNDTQGNSNTTQTWSINVTLDYSWNRDPSFIDAYGFVDTVSNVGVIRINNTGDDTLIITLTDDWPILDIYYNTTEQFPVSSGSVVDVNVTAKYAGFDSVSNMTITIDAEPADPYKTASPESLGTTVTMNSYTGGPYLYLEITEFPTSVYQSQSTNLTAVVKNIGNETAEDVWLNWSLPGGWGNLSGNMSTFIGNMSAHSPTNTSSLVVNVSSSAYAGVSSVCVNANATGGVSNSDCENIAVLCSDSDGVCGEGCTYLNDDNCPAPSGDGGDGDGTTVVSGGGVRDYTLALDAPSRLDINRGENKSFTVVISYGLAFTADDIILELSGYPLTYLSVYPGEYDNVNEGDNVSFDVRVVAPPYIRVGQYKLGVALSGGGKTVNTSITGSGSTVIFVHSVGNESDLFEQARQAARSMIDAGLSVEDFQGMTDGLDELVDDWRYDEAQGLAEGMIATAGLAFRVRDMLGQLDSNIISARMYGFGTPETERLYGLAGAAFQRGDYERAEERANNAVLSFSMETYGLLPLAAMARSYWWAMVIAAGGAGLLGLGLRRRAALEELRRRLRELELEERSIEGLIIRLQRDYFTGRPRIGMESYSKAMEEYESRLAGIRRIGARLRARGARGIVNRLKREREEIIGFMKDIQGRYFRGGVGKSLYEVTMKQMREELGDVEKGIDMLSKKGKKGSSGVMILTLFVVLLAAASVLAQHDMDAALQEIGGAGQAIAEMAEAGFGTSYANDTLNEARIMLSRGEYAAAEALAREVWDIRDAAFEADLLIDQAEEKIYAASLEGIDTSQASGLFSQGVGLFGSENYLESRESLEGAIGLVERLQSEAALKESLQASPGEQLMLALGGYWQVIVLSAGGAVLAVMFVKKRRRLSALRRRLGLLEREKASLERLMAQTQNRYFRFNSLGKLDYDTIMERYRKRMALVEKDISALGQSVRAPERGGPAKEMPKVGRKPVPAGEAKKGPETLHKEEAAKAEPALEKNEAPAKEEAPAGDAAGAELEMQERAGFLLDQAEEAVKKGRLGAAKSLYREVLSAYKNLNKEGAPQGVVAIYERMKRLYNRLRT